MPCKYAIAMDGQLVVEQWSGTLTYDELVAHKTQLSRDPSMQAAASVLTDCRGCEIQISPETIDKLSQIDNDPESNSRVGRYAFLVNRDVYERVQRFSNQIARSGKSALIFNRLEAACQWLGIEPTHVRELIGRSQG
jgi:hypothetical protein